MVIKNRKGKVQDEMTSDQAFDRWVSRQLHKAYDEVLAEDVPPELLELVERWPAAEPTGAAEPKQPAGKRPPRRS